MDIQIGKGGNVDLAMSGCAAVAINSIGRSNYTYIKSNRCKWNPKFWDNMPNACKI